MSAQIISVSSRKNHKPAAGLIKAVFPGLITIGRNILPLSKKHFFKRVKVCISFFTKAIADFRSPSAWRSF
jgi:hypothetical protein